MVSHRIRAEPAVRLISELFCLRSNDGHHIIGVSCCGSYLHSHLAELFHRFDHVRFRICEVRKVFQKFLLAELVNRMDIFLGPVSSIFFFPQSADAFSLKHGPDMVDFKHSHRSSDLLHGRVNSVFMEGIEECLYRCKASVIHCRSCPVKNHCFVFHLSFFPLKILK